MHFPRIPARFAAAAGLVCAALLIPRPAAAERFTMNLTGAEWRLARDYDAAWETDTPHLPPVEVASLPVNPPSWGWDRHAEVTEQVTTLPATVEQFFWGDNGNTEGVAGDYRGVSWWTTTVTLGDEIAGKRVYLDFASVHLRAEVFVNRRLAGYDTVGATPFSVDITDAVRAGENEVAVRITDPAGNFSWNDRQVLRWGTWDIPAVHGFAGITGPVTLRAVDPVHVADIFVMNRPEVTTADFRVTVNNTTNREVRRTAVLSIHPAAVPDETVWRDTVDRTFPPGETTFDVRADVPDAEVWSLDAPALYRADVRLGEGESADTASQRFGFRWFDVAGHGGDDPVFRLNGKRIVLLGGMSWGFWPVNGVYATDEMAARDVDAAKALGMNYMNFHRAIGQPNLMDEGDERGLLMYEEPGGYSCEGADPAQTLWRKWRRIKFLRMVKRDRSRPSVFMYNLQNRTPNPVTDEDVANLRAAREIDPSRIYTFISGFWEVPPRVSPDKLHFLPYDNTAYDTGWFDTHNHTGSFGYVDDYYNGPDNYLRHPEDPGEVIFWGEDGGLYSPPRLARIREWHASRGTTGGWRVRDFLDRHDVYDAFLDRSGFRRWFPDVDAFTVTMGNATLDYHGRIIENVRAGNTGDAYTINGWAAPHIVNQGEIADLYRNPSGDPSLLARYCRPLYVAVKLRDRVAPPGASLTTDIYLVNEENVRGPHTLRITATHESGTVLLTRTDDVDIEGGETYGQLLVEGLAVPVGDMPGYVRLTAELVAGDGTVTADGDDLAYAVGNGTGAVSSRGAVTGDMAALKAVMAAAGIDPPVFDDDMPPLDWILLGDGAFKNRGAAAAVMSRVASGATAIACVDAGTVADMLDAGDTRALYYRGRYPMRKAAFVAGRHPLLDGLPQASALGWEYQVFLRGREALALDPGDVETVIAAVDGYRRDIGVALCVVPYGRGRVILSTMQMPESAGLGSPRSAVAVRLFRNMLMYTGEKGD